MPAYFQCQACTPFATTGQAIKEALEASKDANGEPVCAELSVSSSEKASKMMYGKTICASTFLQIRSTGHCLEEITLSSLEWGVCVNQSRGPLAT